MTAAPNLHGEAGQAGRSRALRRNRGLIARASVAAAVGATSLLLLTGGAASAATAQARSPLPGCVHWKLNDSGFTDHLKVTNGCGSGHWFKVILAHGKDFKCTYYAAGQTYYWSWPWPRKFSALHNC
ncbi:hypothetical protein N5079_30975 [Planotetraspora sp. A-T 1434]|uniref:hypothetical protein n=1 Tax=Planotetraspora sp. A-T 1434 TaxID=2979219 RepID=UPI0021C034F1|nr:hypothetical protein [Planotetraspora sp. A-T 1434]MCT9934639.1 hypothetical protein [Planotetraspora sp. A-T 1434]